jgi:hypothetical protein
MDNNIDNSPGLIDPLLDFPAELDGLQFIGERLIKGGDKRAIHLVKYPARLIAEDEAQKVVVTVWMNWWSKTQYALDPTAPNPHWNSPTRTSEVWAQVGEAAQCESGQPFIFCIRCGIVLQHPVGLQSIGTNISITIDKPNSAKEPTTTFTLHHILLSHRAFALRLLQHQYTLPRLSSANLCA